MSTEDIPDAISGIEGLLGVAKAKLDVGKYGMFQKKLLCEFPHSIPEATIKKNRWDITEEELKELGKYNLHLGALDDEY